MSSKNHRRRQGSYGLGSGSSSKITPSNLYTVPTHYPPHAEHYITSSPYSSDKRANTPAAELAINPCLTHRQLEPRPFGRDPDTQSPRGGRLVEGRSVHSHQGSNTRGDATYRVRPSFKPQWDPTAPPIPKSPPAPTQGAVPHHSTHHHHHPPHQSPPSLSQGIFGIPAINEYDYLRNFQKQEIIEELGGQKIIDENVEDINGSYPVSLKQADMKPRMKSTLPTCRPSTPTSMKDHCADMEGVMQVRPMSRNRSRPEPLNSSSSYTNVHYSNKKGTQRRAQSSVSHNFHSSSFHHHPRSHMRSYTVPQLSDHEDFAELSSTDVDDMLQDALSDLNSTEPNWEKVCEAFYLIGHLTSDCPNNVNSVLKKIIWGGLPHIGNVRSKISKAACQCFKRLYETQGRSMEGEGDKVFQRLLDHSGGPNNRFLQSECKEALRAAVLNTNAVKNLVLLEYGAHHRNANVREVAAHLLSDLMRTLSPGRLMSREYAQKILPLIAIFIREGLSSTRDSAKTCLEQIVDHPHFNKNVKRFIPASIINQIEDTFRKYRKKRR